jgi:hypothetical protein
MSCHQNTGQIRNMKAANTSVVSQNSYVWEWKEICTGSGQS